MPMKTLIALSLSSGLMAACSMQPILRGESVADSSLKSDAARLVTEYAQAMTGCRYPQSIETEVLRVNPAAADSAGIGQFASVEERWVLTGCGLTVPFTVTFRPDAKGGTFIQVTAQPKAPRP